MKHTSKLMPYLAILLMAAIAYTTGTILAKIGALPQSNNTLFSLSAGNNSIQPQLYIIYLLISTIILVLVFRYKREWMAKVFTHMNFNLKTAIKSHADISANITRSQKVLNAFASTAIAAMPNRTVNVLCRAFTFSHRITEIIAIAIEMM